MTINDVYNKLYLYELEYAFIELGITFYINDGFIVTSVK